MKIYMRHARRLLEEHRVFLMGAGVTTTESVGKNFEDDLQINVQPGIELESYSTWWGQSGRQLVTMGAFSYTLSALHPSVSVGRYTSVAAGLRVMGNKHPLEWASTSPVFYNRALMMEAYEADYGVTSTFQPFDYKPGPINVGNDVWIGENVTLSHGITIGDGAVIASNAVVTKDVEPYAVVGGVPARKLRDRFSQRIVADLQRVQWWRYSPQDISDLDVRDPGRFSELLCKRIVAGDITPYEPPKLTYAEFARLA